MFKIEFSDDGFAGALTKAAIESAKQQIRGRLEHVVCPEHGQHIRVTLVGQSLKDLDYKIRGCCQKAIDLATAAMA